MKKKTFPWTDCVTQLTFEKVRNYFQTGETILLNLVHQHDGTRTVEGQIVSLNELSENAFYFWFEGIYLGKPFGLKVKQNVIEPSNRYLEEISLDAIRILKQKQSDEKTNRFQTAYAQYWDMVKNSVDAEGWVYSKETPFLLDAYFEANTGKEIEFQNSYEGEWKGTRWRPKELSPK